VHVLNDPGVGNSSTLTAIAIYGTAAFFGMLGQMAVVSMFAVFAEKSFGLDSLHVGFLLTLAAIASVGTNIWVAPWVQHRVGDVWAGAIGSSTMALGTLALVSDVIETSICGLVIVYIGIAISSSAVACGAANLTDVRNRSTVMTGVRMLKSLGAVMGPIISGATASINERLPFAVTAGAALAAGSLQVLTIHRNLELQRLLAGRSTVGLTEDLLWPNGFQDEVGTPEEVKDLGEFVAQLLTTRHYRWITYNQELKGVLSNFFPPLPLGSAKEYHQKYTWVRSRAQSCATHEILQDY